MRSLISVQNEKFSGLPTTWSNLLQCVEVVANARAFQAARSMLAWNVGRYNASLLRRVPHFYAGVRALGVTHAYIRTRWCSVFLESRTTARTCKRYWMISQAMGQQVYYFLSHLCCNIRYFCCRGQVRHKNTAQSSPPYCISTKETRNGRVHLLLLI